MDVTPIFPAQVQKLWNALELRILVLLSLLLQVFLIFTGNRRKYSKNKWMAAFLWLAYLSADSVATLALGVLSQSQPENDSKDNSFDPKYAITVFWAPFLLMHLGGPDTITAYAMADNELWSRHLLGLISQVLVTVYIYLRSFTRAHLDFLWLVVFFAGVVKYGERTWVLLSASKDRYRDSMVSQPDPGPNYAKFMAELVSREREGYRVSLGNVVKDNNASSSSAIIIPASTDGNGDGDDGSLAEAMDNDNIASSSSAIIIPASADGDGDGDDDDGLAETIVLDRAYFYFRTFRKIFADLILSFQDRQTSVSFFKDQKCGDAFRIVEIELGFVFDSFYTKSPLIFSKKGLLLRFLSCLSTISAFLAFLIFRKKGYPTTEVIITYILLVGAIFLELYAFLMLALSDRAMIWFEMQSVEKLRRFLSMLRIVPKTKRWSNSMGQYNLLDHCLDYMPKHGNLSYELFRYLEMFDQYLEKYLFWRNKDVTPDLKQRIFDELIKKTGGPPKTKSYWKDKILLDEFECFHKSDEVEFDQSLLVWHMATDICYYTSDDGQSQLPELRKKRELCKLMSDYMLYLLIMSPFMLPSGIGKIRFQDTIAEATEFFKYEKSLSRQKACKMLNKVDARFIPSDMKGDRSKSLFFDARRVAKFLEDIVDVDERWDKITQAWVEMLTFAAGQCSWSDHAEKLSQGGELLTHVWLLMAHLGMTDHFQISRGYIRAKLDLN